ncbi:hypothetical protein OZX57_06580 [Bifidobacterium sp. ESL0682]|uniref:hypothetical protein n=1 Tax=Bifidobacterium sp. ESL0682 TaxID=2983212 RepID=UPI0023F8B103|nr:hypothetical protein [Bifidobacterium sp. ESL0682]WEV41652.1 hypothetical protein OZX57_06580 [Bifidobacterium sp. ESL0682]
MTEENIQPSGGLSEAGIADFIHDWRTKTMSAVPRDGLSFSDLMWTRIYRQCPSLRAVEGMLIFRVHHGGGDEPTLSEYDDFGDNQQEAFREDHRRWVRQSDLRSIRFDGHWVSFTKTPKALCSPYFASKGLRGFVIVQKVKKAVDISDIEAWGAVNEENEVVAPLEESQVVEILSFSEFENKYCKQ